MVEDESSFAHEVLKNKFLQSDDFNEGTAGAQQRPVFTFYDTFGKFKIIKQIGQGGAGDVYLAVEPDLQRKVALKILSRVTDQDLERFQREAKITARLDHPNIIKVYETGVVSSRHYISMQYIEGISLDKARLDLLEALTIMEKVSRVIDYAHCTGVIHRDIKPSNIIIDNNQEVYVMDFGIAKQHDIPKAEHTISIEGMIIGTPSFMSPEQASGDLKKVDKTSDVYSLGATLYYLLTGKEPARGKNTIEILNKVVNSDIAEPRTLNPKIPLEVEAIVLKTMNKDKQDRYQTAKELADDISRYLKGDVVQARPFGISTRLLKKLKKKKGLLIPVFCLSVLLVVGLMLIINQHQISKRAEGYEKEGQKYFQGKNWAEARDYFNQYLQLKNNPDIQDRLKYCEKMILEEKQNKEKALQLIDEGIALLENIKTRYYKKDSDPQEIMKSLKNALEVFSESIDTYPLARAYYYRARVSHHFLDYARALDDLDYALKLDPDLSLANLELSQVYFESYLLNLKNPHLDSQSRQPDLIEKALKELEKVKDAKLINIESNMLRKLLEGVKLMLTKNLLDDAIKIFEQGYKEYSSEEFYYWTATAYYMKGDIDKTAECLLKAISIRPIYPMAYFELGITYHLKNDFTTAIKHYKEALKMNEYLYFAYGACANAYLALGDLDGAIKNYTEEIGIKPDSFLAYFNRGTVYRHKNQLDEAIEDLTQAIQLKPKYHQAYNNRGLAKKKKGDLQGAIDDFSAAIEIDPQAGYYHNRGSLYMDTGQLDLALEDFTVAIQKNGLYAEAYNNIGLIKLHKGDNDGAIEDYSAAIKINPNLAYVYFNRAEAYYRKKEYKLARKDLEDCVRLDPSFKDKVDEQLKKMGSNY